MVTLRRDWFAWSTRIVADLDTPAVQRSDYADAIAEFPTLPDAIIPRAQAEALAT